MNNNPAGTEITRGILRNISQLNLLRRRYIDDHLRDHNLRGPMFLIILFLERKPGCIQDELSAYLGVDKSRTTRLCRKLEDLGYIKREQSESDRRKNLMYLTEPGEALIPVIRTIMDKWRVMVTEGIDEDDQKMLHYYLDLMLKNAIRDNLG